MLVIVLILIIQCKSVIKTFFVYIIMSIEPEIISKHQIEVLQKKVIIDRFLLLSFLFCHSSCSFTRGKISRTSLDITSRYLSAVENRLAR